MTNPPDDGVVIFQSADLLIRRIDGAQVDEAVVTFDSYSDERTWARAGFGEGFFRSEGITAFHVISRDNDWYQFPELAEAMRHVREETGRFARVLAYGTSMGGYASVRFADAVGAKTALALSPQYSIDPDIVPFEKRWLADSNRIDFLAELDGPIDTHADILIAYDPTGPDRPHAALIARDVSVQELKIRYAGHSVPALLSEAGLLKPLVLGALRGDIDVRGFERAVSAKKRTLSVYFSELAIRQLKRQPVRAVAFARHAVEINPQSNVAQRVLGDALAESGHDDEARAVYERLLGDERSFPYLMAYSHALSRIGDFDAAVEIAQEADRAMPDLPATQNWLAMLNMHKGALEEALTHVDAALALAPGTPAYSRLRANIRNRLRLRPAWLKPLWARFRAGL